MLGRKIVVVGVPGVPHGAAATADAVRAGSPVVVAAAAGRAPAPSDNRSKHTSANATFLTAASMREVPSAAVLAA
jgi:hypothetical protein